VVRFFEILNLIWDVYLLFRKVEKIELLYGVSRTLERIKKAVPAMPMLHEPDRVRTEAGAQDNHRRGYPLIYIIQYNLKDSK
jgi:hypothetical protein